MARFTRDFKMKRIKCRCKRAGLDANLADLQLWVHVHSEYVIHAFDGAHRDHIERPPWDRLLGMLENQA